MAAYKTILNLNLNIIMSAKSYGTSRQLNPLFKPGSNFKKQDVPVFPNWRVTLQTHTGIMQEQVIID